MSDPSLMFEMKTHGYTVWFKAPPTPAEYDALALCPGQAYKDALAFTCYRRTVIEFHEAMAKELYSLSKLSIGDKETFKVYNRRVRAHLTPEQRVALDATARTIAKNMLINPAPGKYLGRIEQHLVEKTDAIYSKGPEWVQTKATLYLGYFPKFPLERNMTGLPEKDSFARLLGKYLEMRAMEDE